MEYLTWTYFYRCLLANPDYYSIKRQESGVEKSKESGVAEATAEEAPVTPVALVEVQKYLRSLIMDCLADLSKSGCVEYYQSTGKLRQAMIDVAAQKGYLATTLRIMQLSQMLNQGQWVGTDPFYTLPFSDSLLVQALRKIAPTLPELVAYAGVQKNQARLRQVIATVAEPGKNAESKILEAINSLPVVRVTLRLKVNADEEEESENAEPTEPAEWIPLSVSSRQNWIPVTCGATCTLEVISRRVTKRWLPGKKTATSRFPKPKDESWWLVVGEPETGELCALKRIGFVGKEQTSSLLIPVPSEPRRFILNFYLVSDSYFQFDQQIPLFLEAVAQ